MGRICEDQGSQVLPKIDRVVHKQDDRSLEHAIDLHSEGCAGCEGLCPGNSCGYQHPDVTSHVGTYVTSAITAIAHGQLRHYPRTENLSLFSRHL